MPRERNPTPEQIAKRCAIIRSKWSAATELIRRHEYQLRKQSKMDATRKLSPEQEDLYLWKAPHFWFTTDCILEE